MFTRRTLFGTAFAGAVVAGIWPTRLLLANADTERRLVFILQRGAADGLGILAPVGDPGFAALRGQWADQYNGAAKLDSMFTLHPELKAVGQLFAKKEAMFHHAVALPYRERSHFDGQNVLESGGSAPYALHTGWLNRLVEMLPGTASDKAIALSTTIPLILRGKVEVGTYATSDLPEATEDLLARVGALYQSDGQLGPIWNKMLETRQLAGNAGDQGDRAAGLGRIAGSLIGPDAKARIAVIETTGWDTHYGQKAVLSLQLRKLDATIQALRTELGPLWESTLVLVATEFGRTARINGTAGTDHGTASLAMVLGGAIANGGKVMADWPGLANAQLQEGRDLKPTRDLQQILGGALAMHFGLDPDAVQQKLFPAA
jgi:uncharacterized protein (DUF1501 family)